MKWVTRDGTRVSIKDMSDTHLRNARALVIRKRQEARQRVDDGYAFLCSLNGEAAIDHCESAIASAESRAHDIAEWADAWTVAFNKELERRGVSR